MPLSEAHSDLQITLLTRRPCFRRLPARYSIAGGGAPRKRDSVLSRGSLPLPTIHDDEDGGGGNIETAPPPPRGRARFRESIMALVLPVGRRRTTVSFSKSGDGAAPEGSSQHFSISFRSFVALRDLQAGRRRTTVSLGKGGDGAAPEGGSRV